MSATEFAIALGLVALAILGLAIAVVTWAERQPLDDEPTEHGDGEE